MVIRFFLRRALSIEEYPDFFIRDSLADFEGNHTRKGVRGGIRGRYLL